MKKVVLCQHYFNIIGGIETFIINFCKTFYKEYDITLLCRTIDKKTALALSKYINVICIPEDEIKCDTCIISSVLVDEDNFFKVKYKEIYQMIHSDWTEMKKFWDWKFKSYDPNTKFISVSESVRQSALKEFGKDSIVIPNILEEKPIDKRKPLRLLSLCRLTKEKGYERMKKLCDLFEKYDIPYIWDVYGTNAYQEENYKGIILHEPIIGDKSKIIKSSDYVVQLSDTESFCYTMYESLLAGIPVIATPFPNAKQEIKNGKNGYILPFAMNVTENTINKIYNEIPQNVEYKQVGVKEAWKKALK